MPVQVSPAPPNAAVTPIFSRPATRDSKTRILSSIHLLWMSYTTGIHGTSIVSRRKAIIGPNGPCGSSKVAQCSVKASPADNLAAILVQLNVMERNDIHRPPKSLRNDLNKRP